MSTAAVSFPISGKAMLVIDGSSLSQDATQYDGGSQGAVDALEGLRTSVRRKRGKGYSYVVTTTPDGADTIRDYCQTVGSGWVGESDPDTRADARALLAVAARIGEALAKVQA